MDHPRMPGARFAFLVMVWPLCLVHAADGQSPVVRVTTHGGVAFDVPGTFRDWAVPPAQPDGARYERTMTDGRSSSQIMLWVFSFTADCRCFQEGLPDVSGPLSARFARSFAAGLVDNFPSDWRRLIVSHDVVPLGFDTERVAFSLQVNLSRLSPARQMLLEDDSSAAWVTVPQPALIRCVLEQLQGGAPSRSAMELEASSSTAAERCGVPVATVQRLIDQVGSAMFAPEVVVMRIVAFVGSNDITLVNVLGAEARIADVDAAASLVWASATVPPAAQSWSSVIAQRTHPVSAQIYETRLDVVERARQDGVRSVEWHGFTIAAPSGYVLTAAEPTLELLELAPAESDGNSWPAQMAFLDLDSLAISRFRDASDNCSLAPGRCWTDSAAGYVLDCQRSAGVPDPAVPWTPHVECQIPSARIRVLINAPLTVMEELLLVLKQALLSPQLRRDPVEN